MSKRIPLTVLGAQKLREELEYLKGPQRQQIIQAIAEARAHGDLRENAEYHAAKEQQSFNEGRIKEIKDILAHAQIIDVTKLASNGTVVFGATVTVFDVNKQTELVFQIVGEEEADLKQQKISITSPIARALIGKREGDEIEVLAPSGSTLYEVVKIEYI